MGLDGKGLDREIDWKWDWFKWIGRWVWIDLDWEIVRSGWRVDDRIGGGR